MEKNNLAGSGTMNRDYILFHLREAREELSRTLTDIEHDSDYSEAEFEVAMAHLYNHINTAWNARNATNEQAFELTDEHFYDWRGFPQDIDMGLPE